MNNVLENKYSIKLVCDIFLAVVASVLLAVPFILVATLVKATSKGPVLYWSDRVGIHNNLFRMPKFRSMRVDTPAVATHLLENAESALTPIGGFIRKSSLDEIPQLWCILGGHMSFVGPRPALYNQHDLIKLRTKCGVHELLPGLTGWAQINGRDELSISEKVKYDVEYLGRRSFSLDLKILFLTFLKVIRFQGVSH